MLDGAKILRETWEVDDVVNSIVPLYDNEDSVCGIEYNGTAYYFLKNLQGDIIAITDNSGEVIANYTYDAWGALLSVKDADNTDITDESHIANINPFRYRSYYFDLEIQMYYLQSRYYDAQVGRFVNGDEAEFSSIDYETNSQNLFAYCYNNPVNDTDKSGSISVKKVLSIFKTISKVAKEIFQCILDGAETILGIRKIITRKQISKMAKSAGRSPHRVTQNLDWVKNRVTVVKTKAGKIFAAITIIYYLISVASACAISKTIAKIKAIIKVIVEGLAELACFLVEKSIELLSYYLPALGGLLGFVIGKAIGIVINFYFDRRKNVIANNYVKKVNLKSTNIGHYFSTFFTCLFA